MDNTPGYKSINTEWIRNLQDDRGLNIPEQAYLNITLAYRCLRLRCDSLTQIPVELQNEAGEEVDWPFKIPIKELLWFTEAAIIMRNAAFILKVADGNGPASDLMWLNPFSMTVSAFNFGTGPRIANINNHLNAVQFHYASDVMSGSWTNTVENQPIVYLKDFNPISDVLPGRGAMEVVLQSAQLRWFVLRFGSRFFEGGAQPVTILEFAQGQPPEEMKRSENFFKRLASGLKNAFNVIAVSSNLKVHTITPPLDQLALKELMETTEDDILDAFSTPNSLVRDVSNRDLATTQRKSFYEDVVGPRANMISEKFNRDVFSDMGLKLVFSLEQMSMFQVDEANRTQSLSNLWNMGLPIETGMGILGYTLTPEQLLSVQETDQRNLIKPEPQPEAQPIPKQLEPGQPPNPADEDMKRWHRKRLKSAGPVSFNAPHLSEIEHAKVMTASALCFSHNEVDRLFADLKAVLGQTDKPTEERMEDEEEFIPPMMAWLGGQVDRIEEDIDPSGFLSSTPELIGSETRPLEVTEPDNEFWKEETVLLSAFLVTFIAQWLESSIAENAVLLEKVALSVGPEVNAAAADFANKHALELARNLNKTTRDLTRKRIVQFLSSDQSFDDLVTALNKSISPRWRAVQIARTEVTRAYAEGTRQVVAGTEGVKGLIWSTALDERVCPLCGPLEGIREENTEHSPPRHVGCRCKWALEV